MVSTYHLTVRVTSVLGRPVAPPTVGSDVEVGITVDPDVDLAEVEKDFGTLNGGVFFLKESPVYDYQEGLMAIAEDGTLLAVPDQQGDLTFPMLDDEDPVLCPVTAPPALDGGSQAPTPPQPF